MNRHNYLACVIFGCIAVTSFIASAQEFGAADTLYSSGVQAYFGGRPAEAEASLSSLLRVDPNDPRAFYFRALSLMQQGREDEARSDMEIGAQMEARSPNRFDIGKTLERVQGSTRLVLEQYRSQARVTAGMNPPRAPVRAPDAAVLRERRVVPLEAFSREGIPQSFVVPLTVPAKTAPVAAPPKAADNGKAAPPGPANPFADDPAEVAPSKASPKTALPKAAPPKVPPAKAAAPVPPQVEAPIPATPKPPAAAPKAAGDDPGNPFL
jgi:hypothetical protein